MKTNRLTLLTLLIISFISGSCEKDTDQERPEFTLEKADVIPELEYEIYSLVINEIYTSTQIVISQHSETSLDLLDWSRDMFIDGNPDVDTTIFENYRSANDSSCIFDDKFTSDDKQIILISHSELQYIFDDMEIEENWRDFHEEYPASGGLTGFTRIGFNDTYTEAVFEISKQYGGLGGDGKIVYLVKQGNNWIIKDIMGTWIS